jgi:hypothetical protein
MRRERVPDMPILPLFLVFASYGTLLEILVTAVGDIPWSGMHSLGAFALVFGLSWMLPFYGVAQRPHSGLSPYHRITNLLLRIFPLTLIAVGTVIFLGLAAGMD